MSDTANDSPEPAAPPPMPRPPGAARPRRPRAPKQTGGDLEPTRSPAQVRRRTFTWAGLTAFFAALGGCGVKFFFPRTLFEPKTTFKVGYPSEYGMGVDSKWQSKYRIWVCRDAEKLYVIYANCTHLGCTPDWIESANKFKCPCHGSGYDAAGVNFEGPAPRPMDRCDVALAPDGQIVVNVLKLYPEPKWAETGASIKLA
jgi:cytochrome b6-f complex iron-sulfur subunit